MVFKFFDVLVRGLQSFPSTLHVHTQKEVARPEKMAAEVLLKTTVSYSMISQAFRLASNLMLFIQLSQIYLKGIPLLLTQLFVVESLLLKFKILLPLPHKPLYVLIIWPLKSLVQKDIKS